MIILVAGSDVWRVEQDVDRLRKYFVEKFDAAGLNAADHSFLGEYDALMEAVAASPFLSEKRFVIARDLPEEKTEAFEALMQHVSPTTILVLVAKESSERVLHLDTYLQTVTHVPYKQHYYDVASQLGGTEIEDMARHYGVRLSQTQVAELATQKKSGAALHTLFAALKDLEEGPLNESAWRVFVPKQDEQRAFDFLDALFERNSIKSIALCEEMTSGNKELAPLWAMLYTQIRKYYALSLAGSKFTQVAHDMGVSFFEQNKIKRVIQSHGHEYIQEIYTQYEQLEKQGKKAKERVRSALFDLVSLTLSP